MDKSIKQAFIENLSQNNQEKTLNKIYYFLRMMIKKKKKKNSNET